MTKFVNFGMIFIVVLLFTSTLFAQDISKKITINNDLEIVQLTPNVYLHISLPTCLINLYSTLIVITFERCKTIT